MARLSSLPTFRRKYSAVEFKDAGLSSCSLVNGVTFTTGEEGPAAVKQYLLDHAKLGFVRLREIIDRRGGAGDSWNQLIYVDPSKSSDRGASGTRTANDRTFWIITACNIYQQLEGNMGGAPLYDAIKTESTVFSSIAGKKTSKINLASMFDDGGKAVEALLLKHLEVRKILGGKQQFIDKNAPAVLESYVRAAAQCDNLIKDTVVTEAAGVIAQLAHTIGMMISTLTSGKATSSDLLTVKNANRIKLPLVLTSTNASVIKSLVTAHLVDDLISKQKAALELKVSDLFKFNVTSGTIDFADRLISQFIEADCEFTFNAVVESNIIEHKVSSRFSSLLPATQRAAALALLQGKSIDSDTRTLLSVFGNHTADSILVESSMDIPELQAAVAADEAYLKDVRPLVLSIINNYFRPLSFEQDMTGFSLYQSIVNGREMIVRVERTTPCSAHNMLVTARAIGKKPSVRLYGFRMMDAPETNVEQINVLNQKTAFTEFAKAGKKGTVESTCALAFDGAKVLSWVKNFGFYTESSVDLVRHQVITTVRQKLMTIYPPSEGEDCIAFGCSQRRDVKSFNFELSVCNPESVLDSLMAFPPEQVLDASQEMLASLYLNRIKSLTNAPFDDTSVLYCHEIGYSIRDALALFMAQAMDEAVPVDGNMRQILFFPNKLKFDDFEKQALPEFVKIPKSVAYAFATPVDLLNSTARLSLEKIGYYESMATARGTSIVVVSPDVSQEDAKRLLTADDITMLAKLKAGLQFPNGQGYTHNALVKVVLNPYEMMSFSSSVLKNRKNKEYFIRLDYGDPAMNSMVRDSLLLLGKDGCKPFEQSFKRSVNLRTKESRVLNALELAKNIVYSMIYSYNGYFSSLWDSDIVDRSIGRGELKVLRDYLEDYYDGETPLAALGLTTSSLVADFITKVDAYIKVADNDEDAFKALRELASVISPAGLVSLSALALITPMPVDSFTEGWMNIILQNVISYTAKPEISAKLSGAVFNGLFENMEANNIYTTLIEQRFNAAVVSATSVIKQPTLA